MSLLVVFKHRFGETNDDKQSHFDENVLYDCYYSIDLTNIFKVSLLK